MVYDKRPGAVKVKVLLAQALFGNPDILLLDEAKAAGGLKIIGTERHESRRQITKFVSGKLELFS